MATISACVVFISACAAFILVLTIAAMSVHERRQAIRREIQRRRMAAERDIAEIGRATRAAIMDEVQRQLRQGRS